MVRTRAQSDPARSAPGEEGVLDSIWGCSWSCQEQTGNFCFPGGRGARAVRAKGGRLLGPVGARGQGGVRSHSSSGVLDTFPLGQGGLGCSCVHM